MPTPKQMDQLAAAPRRPADPGVPPPGPADDLPEAYWASVMTDALRSRLDGAVPSQPLGAIAQHVLRVTCRRCDRVVEIRTVDAIRLYGPQTPWKQAGLRLLDNGCQQRTGSHEDDGCWPGFDER